MSQPATIHAQRERQTTARRPQGRACFVRVERRKRGRGFWQLDGVEVSVMAWPSSVVVKCQCQPNPHFPHGPGTVTCVNERMRIVDGF